MLLQIGHIGLDLSTETVHRRKSVQTKVDDVDQKAPGSSFVVSLDDLDDLYDSDGSAEGGEGQPCTTAFDATIEDSPLKGSPASSVDGCDHVSTPATAVKESRPSKAPHRAIGPRQGTFRWNLPDELIFYLGLKLGWSKAAFCCEVSRKWCTVLRGDVIWATFLQQRPGLPSSAAGGESSQVPNA